MNFKISNPDPSRFKEIHELVMKCDGIEKNAPHFYKIAIEYWNRSSLIAEDETGRIVGFTFGITSQSEPDLFFLWQIAVSSNAKRKGVGSGLLKTLMNSARSLNCKRFRVTVEADNHTSLAFFEKEGFQKAHDIPHLFDHYGEGDQIVVLERKI